MPFIKNRIAFFSVTFLILMVVFYLIGAFINISFNPLYWSESARLAYGTIGILLAIFISLIIIEVFK
jgi:hypothetical protein